jgi:glycosyltransferase involved in cell wall biosynthesis
MLTQVVAKAPTSQHFELVDGFVKGRVSVIMPAYNEADCIRLGIEGVKKQFGSIYDDYEIIIVDDGSLDGTRNVVSELVDQGIKLVSYDRNEGKGFAFRKGFSHATGEITFLVDSDAEIMATDLAAYLESLRTADIVIGSKRHPLSNVRTPVLRRFLSLGFNMLERLLTGVRATDTQAGFKAMKSRVVYRVLPLITAKRFAFDVEFLAVASLLNFKVTELPVNIDLKAFADPRAVSRMMVDLLGIAYRLRITRWYQRNIAKMSSTYNPIIRW